MWWVSRRHGIDGHSLPYEYLSQSAAERRRSGSPPTVDWSFTIFGGQLRVNLEVKNRVGTYVSRAYETSAHLFRGESEKPFAPSAENELNVLVITSYSGDSASESELAASVRKYLDEDLVSKRRPVIDAVALWIPFGTYEESLDRLYFPPSRDLHKKDLIIKAAFREVDLEDQARYGLQQISRSLPDVIRDMNR